MKTFQHILGQKMSVEEFLMAKMAPKSQSTPEAGNMCDSAIVALIDWCKGTGLW